MKTLILLRHAEAAPGADDRKRRLTPHGEAQARAAGAWLDAHGNDPALILHSPALRTRDTAMLAAAEFVTRPAIRAVEGIYNAMPGDMIEIIRKSGGNAPCLMLVGHNPGIQTLAALLAAQGGEGADELLRGFNPATAMCFEVEVAWESLEPGVASLTRIFRAD